MIPNEECLIENITLISYCQNERNLSEILGIYDRSHFDSSIGRSVYMARSSESNAKLSFSLLAKVRMSLQMLTILYIDLTLRSLINVQCMLTKFPKKYRPVRSY